MPRMRAFRRRAAVMALVCAATLWIARYPILHFIGRSLVHSDAMTPADIIVVGVATDGAGVLEAADLVHNGVADRVAIFEDPPDEVDREFLRRGLPYEDEAARSIRQLASLGVMKVERIPRTVDGTEAEGQRLPEWSATRHFRVVVVVTTADHSRRLTRVLRRAMRGLNTRVVVRAARYSTFREADWWQTREGTRIAIIEFEKLVLDVLRHPFS
jgi:hypothetical protein